MKTALGVGLGLFLAPIALLYVLLIADEARKAVRGGQTSTMGPGPGRFVYGRWVC
jgi:hypothetical protein